MFHSYVKLPEGNGSKSGFKAPKMKQRTPKMKQKTQKMKQKTQKMRQKTPKMKQKKPKMKQKTQKIKQKTQKMKQKNTKKKSLPLQAVTPLPPTRPTQAASLGRRPMASATTSSMRSFFGRHVPMKPWHFR